MNPQFHIDFLHEQVGGWV